MEKNDTLIIIVAILLLLTIGGVAYYAQTRNEANILFYEGPGGKYRIDIIRHGTSIDYYVHTIVEGKEYIVPLAENPEDLENVTLSPTITETLERPNGIQTVFVTQDLSLGNETQQDSIIALHELGKVLGNAEFSVFKLNYRSAFTTATNRTVELNIPAITCANVTDDVAVIHLRLGTETQVADQNDCIVLQGSNGHELLRATYKFIYHILGVL